MYVGSPDNSEDLHSLHSGSMRLTAEKHPTKAGVRSVSRLGPTVDHALAARTIRTNTDSLWLLQRSPFTRVSLLNLKRLSKSLHDLH